MLRNFCASDRIAAGFLIEKSNKTAYAIACKFILGRMVGV